jgi:hypothetical protein
MDKNYMMQVVYNQLAIDYNCSPQDFLQEGLIFTEAKELKGRRPYPFITPRLELITFGNGVVINVSSDILPLVKNKLEGKTRFDIFKMPFICGVNPYFLPDFDNLRSYKRPDGFDFEFVEKRDIANLYEYKGFDYALRYNVNSFHPEVLAIVAKHKGYVVGVASASAECDTMWQINVDVLSPYRGNNLAVIMVNALTIEALKRGIVPYYSTDCSNLASQRVAVKSGYIPTWSHCFRTTYCV